MFKSLKIKRKLILSFVIVSLISCISGVVSVTICKNIDTKYSDALISYGFSQGDIGKLMSAFCRVDGNVHDAISYYEKDHQTAASANVIKQGDQIPAYFDAVSGKADSSESKALLDTARKAWDEYYAKAKELIALRTSDDSKQIHELQVRLVDELDPPYLTLYGSLASLMDLDISSGTAISIQLTNFTGGSILFTIILILVSLAMSITLGILTSAGIAKPMQECTNRLLLLSKGDVTSPVPVVNSRDEVGQLANATKIISEGLKSIIIDEQRLLGEMSKGNFDVQSLTEENYIGDFEPLLRSIQEITHNLNDTLSSINQSADQVSSGSDQVSAGAQALSQGATEQASSVEELAATITEIYGQVQSNAESAQSATDKVLALSGVMQTSNTQMQQMIEAMSQISQSSGQIGKIIKTIEDIAFQTNILALNAAVEAARAGAAGKGFAVVADEVRNLASKSAEASKNTSALIEQSIRAVENGTSIVDTTAHSLLEAVDGAQEVTTLIEKISAASTEQAQAIAQVTSGVDQISSVVQTNSATAEESAAASEELSSQAQLLKDLVSRFHLRGMGPKSEGSSHRGEFTSAPSKHVYHDGGSKY